MFRATAEPQWKSLTHTEWETLEKSGSPVWARMRSNAIVLKTVGHDRSSFPPGQSQYYLRKEVEGWLFANAMGLYFARRIGEEIHVFLYNHRDAMNLRLRWHDAEVEIPS